MSNRVRLNALIRLLRHHLEAPGATPLKARDVTDAKGNVVTELQPNPQLVPEAAPLGNGTPDKIVVYLAFPEHLSYILPVSFYALGPLLLNI